MSVCLLAWMPEEIEGTPRPFIRVYFPAALHRNEAAALQSDPLIEAKWNDKKCCFDVPASSHEHLENWALTHFKFVDTSGGYPFWVGPDRDPNQAPEFASRYAQGMRRPWGKWRGAASSNVEGEEYKWKVPRNAEAAWRAEHDKEGFASQFGHNHEEDRRVFGAEANERGHDCTYTRLMKYVKPETMKKIYRLIMLDVHPDHGGSDEGTKVANVAWDAIKKERGIE